MPTTRLLSEAQRVRLAALPEMGHRERVRRYTLSEADLAAVSVRRGGARLGFAAQLCLLRYPGRPLRQGEVVPRDVVEFVAYKVGARPDAFGGGFIIRSANA